MAENKESINSAENGEKNKIAENIKKVVQNKIFLAILSIVLGVILIARQKAALDSLVWITGIVLLVSAAVFILIFAFKKDKHPSQLILGIVFAILGLLFAIKPGFVVNAFPVIIGIILIISGLMDLGSALTAPEGTSGKGLLILFSIVLILFGVLCIFQPGAIANAITLLIGIFLLINGIFDLILLIFIRKDD